MFKNYFKVAWLSISRNKAYSAINVIGLALGICACITLFLITNFEFSFDTFHPDKERIYHVAIGIQEGNGNKSFFQTAPLPAPAAIRRELTGIEAVAGFQYYGGKISIPHGSKPPRQFDNSIVGSRLPATVIAEQQYFSIFKYDWLAGNEATALNEPNRIVLTESSARQYFGPGSLGDMIGKTIIFDDSLLVQVSGIVRDWNENTDFPFTNFISFSTISHSFLKNDFQLDDWDQKDTWTLVKLSKGVSPDRINKQLTALVKRHVKVNPQKVPHLANLSLSVLPLSNLHFNGNFGENELRTADLNTLHLIMGVALFILFLAVVNYINLSTAQAIRRAKEVGVRKVLGGKRINLVYQFFVETIVITANAGVLSVLLVNPVLLAFHSFIPTGVVFHPFTPGTLVFLLLVTGITSILAGFYPAIVLSGYKPLLCLKGTGIHDVNERTYLRKALVIFQFAVALVFIIGAIVINSQLRFIRSKPLGFNSESIVTLYGDWSDSVNKMQLFANEIRHLPGVRYVGLESNSPLSGNVMGMSIKLQGRNENDIPVGKQVGDENFVPLYQLQLLAGRNFISSDSLKEFVINESCSKLLGFKYPAQAIGQILFFGNKMYPIVGIVADFHQLNFHETIRPMCIVNTHDRKFEIAVKLEGNENRKSGIGLMKTTIALMGKQFKEIFPNSTFNFKFFDKSIAQLYEKDYKVAWLMDTAMIITIFISCLGLFGLAMFVAEQRTREIGIRKVLGATVAKIVTMLSKDFIVLVIIAFVISSPIGYYFMNVWLQNFAYKVNMGGWVFLTSGFAVLMVALLAVSFQAFKAAIANPVKSLRTE
ncbi:MAG: ABC transporter permease [Puia sp.]